MADISNKFENGQLRYEWDVATRTYNEYDETGVIVDTRPFNAEENLEADGVVADQSAETVKKDLETKIQASLDAVKAQLGSSTDAAGYTSIRAMQNLLATKANTDALTVRDGKNILNALEKTMLSMIRADKRLLEQYDTAGE